MSLSSWQQLRYGRQAILDGVGVEGQKKLSQASVLIIGVGGLGCPASLYLTAAGVGTLGLIDPDVVSESNLHRQVLYTSADVGQPKVAVAETKLKALNPEIKITSYQQALTADNALALIQQYDLVLDGTDNFATRYLVNDACVLAKKVNVYGSILRFEGQVSLFGADNGPCYRCLFPVPPEAGTIPNCAEAGVIGTLPGIVGTTQANEAIKWILGIGEPLIGQLMLYDALSAEWNKLSVEVNFDCPICGHSPTITELKEEVVSCSLEAAYPSMSIAEFKQKYATGTLNLLDVRSNQETQLGCIENAICIPLAELTDRMGEMASLKEQPLVVTCQKGPRAEKAYWLLKENGFKRVCLLDGGMEAYLR